jgi:hypothetical protein
VKRIDELLGRGSRRTVRVARCRRVSVRGSAKVLVGAFLLLAACTDAPETDPFDIPEGETTDDASVMSTRTFQTPSGNIGCLFDSGQLRCDISSGMIPQPTRLECPSASHWAGVVLERSDSAEPNCAGDGVVDPSSPVLRYGSTWTRAGITCVSRRVHLRCTNEGMEGFTLARAAWTTFAEGGRSLTTDSFQTNSGGIVCVYLPGQLRCDLRGGLEPAPEDACPVDWVGAGLEVDGVSFPICAGDALPVEGVPVLADGRSWRLAEIECTLPSESAGLTCTNEAGRGFVLAAADWRTF